MRARSYLPRDGFLFEFGSNIGHFLRHVRPSVGRILGLDPARAVADLAQAEGVPTVCAYFSLDVAQGLAADHGQADVVVARHCAAHNADAHELVAGAARLLNPTGVFVMENAYGLNTLLNQEIGQIYHEHMFYYTASAVRRLFAAHGLELIDLMFAEDIHGGSMVFFGAPAGTRPVRRIVEATLAREDALLTERLFGLLPAATARWRADVRELFDRFRRDGRSVWLYGASAKAATFVNVVGITADDAPFCADSSPTKIGCFMPGVDIQIVSEADAIAAAPDYFLITAWNYRDELMRKVRAAGNARSGFAVPFPSAMVIDPAASDTR
jgi:SAM-dependent methyltransferase